MKPLFHLLTAFLVFTKVTGSFGEGAGQVIRGVVSDKQSKTTLPGANVVILSLTPPAGASADSEGRFRITGIKPGRYDLKASYIGYQDVVISNVVVTSGKEVVLEIVMEETIQSLKEVVVSGGKKNETINSMTSVSSRSFSMEEANRYSGGRSDPSRLVSNFAGVSSPNDARNDIVIRGNSPTGVLYRMEGLAIANPNHFATLGTTGGPVSALNTNVLDNSDFLTSAYPAEYGNANAGVFDIKLRQGNTEKPEFMIQLGALTGVEAMAEGPLRKGKNSSYLAAYRYSFTGLSQELGIPIGTSATPYYQDLTFKITSGETGAGQFKLFGLGGISHIAFKHDQIDSTDIYVNPNQDTYSQSKLGVIGISHFIRLSRRTYISTVAGVTYAENGYDLDTVQGNEMTLRVRTSTNSQIRYALSSALDTKFNARFTLKAGIQAELMKLELHTSDRMYSTEWEYLMKFSGNTGLVAAFVAAKWRVTGNLTLNGGLRSQFLTLNNSLSLEPRIGVNYQFTPKYSVSAGYGYTSQCQTLPLYFYRELQPDGFYNESNLDLGFTNSQQFVVSFDALPFTDWRIKAEIYCQLLSDVPVSLESGSFSMLNDGSSFAPPEVTNLTNNGTGTNYGVELTIEKFFSRGFYGLITGSFYSSRYKGSDGIERNTAYNGNYVYNILAGKELRVGKAKRNFFTIDMKFSQAGGRYYTPVDEEASRQQGKEVLKGDDFAFSERYPGFMRLDLKVGFTLNSKQKKLSQSLYVDIQNITNHKNVFMQQYNPATQTVNTLYQIGFFPNFVYQIQF